MRVTVVVLIVVSVFFWSLDQAEARRRRRSRGAKEEVVKELPLYERLGGKTGVAKIIDEFAGLVAADERVKGFFAATLADNKRLNRFKSVLNDQLCEISGGPCKYKGKSMKEAHKDMALTDDHFNALVEDLSKALEKMQVGEREKNQLLSTLGPLRAEIVDGGKNAGQPAP